MACERYRGALADVGAGAPASTEFEAHLAGCPACRAELEAVQRALALADASLRDLLAAGASPALRARIRKAVGEDAERVRGRRRFFWTWGAAPVGTALMVLAALVVWRQARVPQPSGPSVVQSQGQPTGVDMSRPAERTPSALPTSEARALASAETSTGRHSIVGSDTRAARARLSTALTRAASAEPEVLVPRGEAEALLRFAVELRHRRVAPDSLLVADLAAPLPEPKPIEIAPLEIVPLDPSGTF